MPELNEMRTERGRQRGHKKWIKKKTEYAEREPEREQCTKEGDMKETAERGRERA